MSGLENQLDVSCVGRALDAPFADDLAIYVGRFPRLLELFQLRALPLDPQSRFRASALYSPALIPAVAISGFKAQIPAIVAIALFTCYEAARYERSINRAKLLFSREKRELYELHKRLVHSALPYVDTIRADDPRLTVFNATLFEEIERASRH